MAGQETDEREDGVLDCDGKAWTYKHELWLRSQKFDAPPLQATCNLADLTIEFAERMGHLTILPMANLLPPALPRHMRHRAETKGTMSENLTYKILREHLVAGELTPGRWI